MDMNGDGNLDLIAGAPAMEGTAGTAFLVFLTDNQSVLSHRKVNIYKHFIF